MRINGHSFVSASQDIGNFTDSLPGAPLSPNLMEYLGLDDEEEPSARAMLSYKLADYVKPCHDLGYCPYGSVVEMMPYPPQTVRDCLAHIKYLKGCLASGKLGEDEDARPLDAETRSFFEEVMAQGTAGCVEELSRFEDKAACEVFGHICPVYFLAEDITDALYEDDYDDEEDWLRCAECEDKDDCDAYKEHAIMLEVESALSGEEAE